MIKKKDRNERITAEEMNFITIEIKVPGLENSRLEISLTIHKSLG